MKRGMKTLGLLLVVLVAAPLSGFTVSTLWGWFLVPLGVPAIGIAHGIGIDFLFTFLRGMGNPPKEQKHDGFHFAIAASIIHPFSFLLFGYLIHLVMGL